MNQAYLEDQTGCLFPCTYNQYRLMGTDLLDFDEFGMILVFGSLRTTVLREYYIYPIECLVSDFGGSLGLFVGFSFVMLWDVVEFLIIFVGQKMNLHQAN